MRKALLVLASAALMAVVGTGTAGAAPNARADGELWSPKGLNVGVWKTWTGDGHGGYNGQFQWGKRDSGVWVQMRITWESGRLEQQNMTFGKLYHYNGAYDVYLRACDSSGCAGWW